MGLFRPAPACPLLPSALFFLPPSPCPLEAPNLSSTRAAYLGGSTVHLGWHNSVHWPSTSCTAIVCMFATTLGQHMSWPKGTTGLHSEWTRPVAPKLSSIVAHFIKIHPTVHQNPMLAAALQSHTGNVWGLLPSHIRPVTHPICLCRPQNAYEINWKYTFIVFLKAFWGPWRPIQWVVSWAWPGSGLQRLPVRLCGMAGIHQWVVWSWSASESTTIWATLV